MTKVEARNLTVIAIKFLAFFKILIIKLALSFK